MTITLAQSTVASYSSTGNPLFFTLPTATVAGNLGVFYFSQDPFQSMTSASIGTSGMVLRANSNDGGGATCYLFTLGNIPGGQTVITAVGTASSTGNGWAYFEFSGVNTLDVQTNLAQFQSAYGSGSVTTNYANEAWTGAVSSGATPSAPNSPPAWTASAGGTHFYAGYTITTSTGGLSFVGTQGSQTSAANAAAFHFVQPSTTDGNITPYLMTGTM